MSLSYTAAVGDAGAPIRVAIEDFYEGAASYRIDNATLSVTPVPEPASFAALAAGAALACAGTARRRRA